MAKLRVNCFSISLDGFGAGPRQDLQHPLGIRGTELHQWFFPTEIFQKMQGQLLHLLLKFYYYLLHQFFSFCKPQLNQQ